MIQIYRPGNNVFTKNGDAVLLPITCQVRAELNGTWLIEIEAPIDDENRWRLIEVGAVIKAPSFNGEQLFRIRQTEKKDSSIKATGEPIFLDAVGDCFILDKRIINKGGQEALNIILSGNEKYSASTDITRLATAYYVRKNALEAIAGSDNGFLIRWGGEILYNNYEIIINDRVGGDYGASLLYGKNIPVDGMSEAVNMDGVCTRIIPKAYNGYLLAGDSPWVDSPIINAYPTVMTKVVEYENIRLAQDVEGEDTEGLIICDTMQQLRAALTTAAEEEFQNGIDKPTVSISADMVMLSNTVEYRDYKDLEQVSLGDTIHCKHNRLGIVTDARIIGLTYDCVRKAVTNVSIGEHTASFMDRVASAVSRTEKAIKPSGTVRAEQVQGFIDGVYAQLRVQNTVARRQESRAILFEDLDPSSPTYGALSIGTQGWQISQTRTADGRDWVWTTAATASGLVADAITTGTLNAINITGSTITGSTLTNIRSDGSEGVKIEEGRIYFFKDGIRHGRLASTNYEGDYGVALISEDDYTQINRNTLFYGATGRIYSWSITEGSPGAFETDPTAGYLELRKEGRKIRLSTINNSMRITDGTDEGVFQNNLVELNWGANRARYGTYFVELTDGTNSASYRADQSTISDGTNTALLRPGRMKLQDGTKVGNYYPDWAHINDGTDTSSWTVKSLLLNDGNKAGTYKTDQATISDGTNTALFQTGRLKLQDGTKVGNYYPHWVSINNGTDSSSWEVNRLVLTEGNKKGYMYEDKILMVDGTTLVWGTEYRANDPLNYGFGVFAGHVTNGTKSIDFFIPTNISCAGRTASISVPGDCSVRTPSGYINGSQYLSSTGITVTSICKRNGISVRFTSSSAFTNVSNNQPVSVAGTFNITFTA